MSFKLYIWHHHFSINKVSNQTSEKEKNYHSSLSSHKLFFYERKTTANPGSQPQSTILNMKKDVKKTWKKYIKWQPIFKCTRIPWTIQQNPKFENLKRHILRERTRFFSSNPNDVQLARIGKNRHTRNGMIMMERIAQISTQHRERVLNGTPYGVLAEHHIVKTM